MAVEKTYVEKWNFSYCPKEFLFTRQVLKFQKFSTGCVKENFVTNLSTDSFSTFHSSCGKIFE
jgi:hypothetical protein